MAGLPIVNAAVSLPAYLCGYALAPRVFAGTTVTVQVRFSDSTADGVLIYAAREDGSVVAPVMGPTQVSPGIWRADFLTDVAGLWTFQGYCASPVAALDELQLRVLPSIVTRPGSVVPAGALLYGSTLLRFGDQALTFVPAVLPARALLYGTAQLTYGDLQLTYTP